MSGDMTLTDDGEKTRPPLVATRFESLRDLYVAIPALSEMTLQRPQEGEEPVDFLLRLRDSATPEEAITFAAFAVQPKIAIWWGHECLRNTPQALTALDRAMMEKVARWIGQPDTDIRQDIMRDALWAPAQSPGVFLGLAVGWSGGAIAPNDPAPVAPHRAPRAINRAVLSCLGLLDLRQRPAALGQFTNMAESLFKVY